MCASEDIAIYLEGELDAFSTGSIGQSRRAVKPGTILRCKGCGFGFSELRPDARELARLYSHQGTEVYAAELAGRRKTAQSHLRIVQRYRLGGRLLDIGCATGQFLEQAALGGYEVVGIEPSPKQCAAARTVLSGKGRVLCGTLAEVDLPPGSFDVVTLWDVLEHVVDPVGFLGDCAARLSEGGLLFVNVPQLDSLVARVFGSRWPLLLPEHLNYFTRASLELCGSRAGLRLIRFRQRPAYFSVGYVLRRLGQHRVPGLETASALLEKAGLGGWLIPVPLGESLVVWSRD